MKYIIGKPPPLREDPRNAHLFRQGGMPDARFRKPPPVWQALLGLVFKWLSRAALVAWFAGWCAAWLISPWPKWLVPATLAMLGVWFVSGLLYYGLEGAVETRFGAASEAGAAEVARRELDTLRGRLKYFAYPYCYLWPCAVVVAYASLHAPNTLHLRSVIAAPLGLIIGTVAFWLLMLAYAKGWLSDDESGF